MPYIQDSRTAVATPELQPAPAEVQITKVPTAIRKLQKWTTKTNIADDLTTEKLNELGQLVVLEYDIDLDRKRLLISDAGRSIIVFEEAGR